MQYLTQFDIVVVVLGFVIGVMAIIFGATMFISAPLFMYLFPEATLGQIVGNIKLGSVLRNIGSTLSTYRQIDFIGGLTFSWPFVFGAILGATLISELDQRWLLPMVVIAIFISEYADRLKQLKIPKEVFFLAAFSAGIYGGFLGIGMVVLLISLLRIEHPDDQKIAWVRIQALFLELIVAVATIATHFVNRNIVFQMWFFWAIGSLFGGITGGMLLRWTEGINPRLQRIVLRGTYVFALAAAGMVYFMDWKEIVELGARVFGSFAGQRGS